MKYWRFVVNVALVAVLTAAISSLLVYLLGLLDFLGALTGIVTALIIAGIFVWSTRIREGRESFTEAIPVIVLSIAVVELLRGLIPQIPAIISTFSWTNLAIVLSSVWLSDAVIKKYLLKK